MTDETMCDPHGAVTVTNQPAVGAIGLCSIRGGVGTLIRFGQWLNGDGFSVFEHAFVCIDVHINGDAAVVQAEPGGATYGRYGPEDNVWWCHFPIDDTQRSAIAAAARTYLGVPYSFLDYLALALHRIRVPVPLLRRYISSTHHMICSALADRCYQDAGVQLFQDKRWIGFVTPGSLLELDTHRENS